MDDPAGTVVGMASGQPAGSDFLGRLSDDSRRALDLAAREYHYPAGRVVWSVGQAGQHVLVITDGRLKVTIASAEGDDTLVAIIGPGDLIGELALITGSRRSARITAIDDVRVRSIASDAFSTLVDERADVRHALLSTLAARVENADQRIEVVNAPVERRVAAQLCHLADRFGRATEDGSVRIDIPLTQQELASLVWATRVSVARTLRDLREAGLVRTGRREIEVLDPDGLRELAP